MAQTTSKVAILQWVNDMLSTEYPDLTIVPAKAAARLLNAMFGDDSFPIMQVQFDDSQPTSALKNCDTVLHNAKAVGYNGTLEAIGWLKRSDFTQILMFWRWVRMAADEHPIPTSFDFTMKTHATASNAALAVPANALFSGSSSPGLKGVTMGSDSSEGVKLEIPADLADSLAPAPAPIPLSVLEPNRSNPCAECGVVCKALFESNAKEAERLAKLHKQLVKALSEKQTMKVVDIFSQLYPSNSSDPSVRALTALLAADEMRAAPQTVVPNA